MSSTPLIWLLVALGAGVGATLRFTLAHTLDARWPTGTMAVNVVGSFLLGVLSALALSDSLLALLGTGFCGGFTTYSALANDTGTLLRAGLVGHALAYALGTVVLGLAASVLGVHVARARAVRRAAA